MIPAALLSCASLALCFWHAELVLRLQQQHSTRPTEVMVTFGQAFYLIAVAALCQIGALVIAQHT
jgi:hypothetical protein